MNVGAFLVFFSILPPPPPPPVFTHSGWQNICKVTRPVPGLSRLLFWGGGGHHLAIDRGKKRGLRKKGCYETPAKVSIVRQSTKMHEFVANCLVSVQTISFFFCLADTVLYRRLAVNPHFASEQSDNLKMCTMVHVLRVTTTEGKSGNRY